MTYWLRNYHFQETATMMISTTFEVDVTICCQVTALLVRIHYMTL